jgi:hypothetical protein
MSVPSYSRWLRHRTTYRQWIPPCLKDSTARSQHTRPTFVNPLRHVHAPCIALESFTVSFLVISLPSMRPFSFSFFRGRGGDALVNFTQITRTLITGGCTSTAGFLSVRGFFSLSLAFYLLCFPNSLHRHTSILLQATAAAYLTFVAGCQCLP